MAAQHDVLMQLLAAQIEEAVAQPHVFWIILLAEHGHRQFGGGSQNLDSGDIDFDEAGRHFRIFGARGASPNRAVDQHDPFRTKLFGLIESWRIRIHHALGNAIVIAQIDEQHAAMIANAMAPAGKTNRFAGLHLAKAAAAMGTIAVHYMVTSKRKRIGRACGLRQPRGEPHGRRRLSRRGCEGVPVRPWNAREPIADRPPLQY